MAQQNWWEQDEVYVPPARGGNTLQERKGEADITQSGASVGKTVADTITENATRPFVVRKAKADAITAEKAAERGPPQNEAEVKRAVEEEGKAKRAATIRDLMKDVRGLYDADIKGQPITRLFGATEYIDALPTNERFTAAGNNLLPLIRPLVAQSAREGDSDKEMSVFQSYIPIADDTDATIEYKLGALEKLIDGMLQGKPPSAVEQDGALGLTGTVTDEGVPPAAGGAAPPPSGPVDGGGVPAPDSEAPTDYSPSGIAKGLSMGLGSVAEGVGNLAGMLGGNALGTLAYRAAGYDKPYEMGPALRELIGLPKNTTGADTAIQGGTMALTGAGAARGLASMVPSAAWQGALGKVGATPIRDAVAGAAAVGAGDAVADAGGGTGAQLAASLGAGMLGYGGASGINRLLTKYGVNPNLAETTVSPLMQAAARQNIDVLPADAGGVGTRMATGIARRTLGEIPIAEGAERSLKTASNARDRVAAEMGRISDDTGAGQAAQRGARKFIDRSKTRGEQLYDTIDIEPTSEAVLDNTRAGLAEITKGFTSNRELSKIWAEHPRLRETLKALTPTDVAAEGRRELAEATENLAALRGQFDALKDQVPSNGRIMPDLMAKIASAEDTVAAAAAKANQPPQGGKASWEDLKRLRSIVGEIVGQPSLTSDGNANAALRKFYGALSSDMEATAAAAGPKALDQFSKANRYWRGRQDRIDTVLNGVLGNNLDKGEAAAFEQINRWAQAKGGDFNKLARTIRSLPADEADEVRASVFGRLGTARPGQQNTTGTQFSPAEFSTGWSSMSDRAKNVLFPDAAHRRNIDDLVTVMDGMKRANDYANVSKTSLGVNAAGKLTMAATGGPVGALLAGLTSAGEFALGKYLASPKLAQTLARASKLPPEEAARKLPEQLALIATRNPALASDARMLQQQLERAMQQSPVARARAGEEDE